MDRRAPRDSVLDIGTLLTDRMLTIARAGDITACGRHVNVLTGGLVISGDKQPVSLHSLAGAYPGLPLLREPAAPMVHVATATDPFHLSVPGELFALTLSGVLDGQRASGASGALTPTGFIGPDAEPAMIAAVTAANRLERDDVLVWLPCHWRWVTEPRLTRLIAVARTSRHPVALSLSDPMNPLEHPEVPLGLRRAVAEIPRLVLWRVDLAGIDALAHGATAAAIGIVPSLRHLTEPGSTGFASTPGQRSPHVFLPDLLRFVRAHKMQDDWYASIPAPTCPCPICAGAAVDRFDGTSASRLLGHLHNVVQLTYLHSDLLGSGRGRRQWWHERLDDARTAHHHLAGLVSTPVPFPKVLNIWSKN
jgi:hypothetical protein